MCNKINQEGHIPQEGAKLIALRKSMNQRQSSIATQLETFLKPHMKKGFSILQPDISRLECEDTALDVPKLLAYAHLFGVDISMLLKPHFQTFCQSEFRLRHFDTDQQADQHLCQLENEGRMLAYSQFPSAFFVNPHQNSQRFQQIAHPDYVETHIHTLDSLLNFIFSPVSRYSCAVRGKILQQYLEHFRQKPKHLHFFSRAEFSSTSLFPSLILLPKKSTLIMLAPVMQPDKGDVFLEIRSELICKEVHDFYIHTVQSLDANISLLKIGMETLELLQQGISLESAVRFFYAEVQKRSPEDSAAVLENFSLDIQEMLEE
ncbi:hypothetical protein [Thiothrix winogradskyi]|uniref:HTH cro/C1-type domain-containing protein n=1 Tax=Thiothrix winogradskyi TaxID=96472 RepID=A0ABY3STL4_9GAMM|nr:hypothetical protein [Thiothrix winogradskyi]UJS22866.1 hypothetical protein L2Y54_13040 [Thiothrix winogradskyi]